MGRFGCLVQEGSRAVECTEELEAGLAELHARHYPDDAASVSWRTVPPGYMFTEGRQSTSSIIACVITWPTELAEREAYMRDVCDLWTGVTGCTDHEVVVAVTEVDPL